MKTRKHHNNLGTKQIKSGHCERDIIHLAKKLGVRYESRSNKK